jgi:hypothetical protein
MKLNFKQAMMSLVGSNSFFTNMIFGAKLIDTTPYDRTEIVKAYKNSAEARLVIGKVMDSFTSIPIKWVNKDGSEAENTKQEEILKSPNALQTQMQFEKDWIMWWCLMEENFIHGGEMGVALSKGMPSFLKMLPGQYVDFELKDGEISKYVNSFATSNKLDPQNVKATIGSVLDPVETLHATSKLITASKLLKKLEQGHDMDITAYGNKGANYLVTADGDVIYDKEKAMNAQEQINNPNLNGGVRFMGAKAQVHDISKTPADLNILETSKDARKVLAMLYGVPIPLVSEDASTYDNVKASETMLALNTTIPLKQLFCDQLSEFLGDKSGVHAIVDVDKVKQIQKDPKDVQEVLNNAKASVNERRIAAGLEPLKGKEYDLPVLQLSDQLGYATDFNDTDLE